MRSNRFADCLSVLSPEQLAGIASSVVNASLQGCAKLSLTKISKVVRNLCRWSYNLITSLWCAQSRVICLFPTVSVYVQQFRASPLMAPHPGQGTPTQKLGFTRDRCAGFRPFSPEPSTITSQPRHFGCIIQGIRTNEFNLSYQRFNKLTYKHGE